MSKNSPSYKGHHFIHIIIDDTGEEQIYKAQPKPNVESNAHDCSNCRFRLLRDGTCFSYSSPFFGQPVSSQEVCILYKEES